MDIRTQQQQRRQRQQQQQQHQGNEKILKKVVLNETFNSNNNIIAVNEHLCFISKQLNLNNFPELFLVQFAISKVVVSNLTFGH